MYYAWWIPAHLRYSQCSILLYFIYICFLKCICLWQRSQIQNLVGVVGPGLVSTLPTFMRSSASQPGGSHGRLVTKTVNWAPLAGGKRGQHNLHRV